MKKIILLMTILISIISCQKENNKIFYVINLGKEHNKTVDFVFENLSSLENKSFESVYNFSLDMSLEYVGIESKYKNDVKTEIDKMIKDFFVTEKGIYIFDKQKVNLIEKLSKLYSKNGFSYLLKADKIMNRTNIKSFDETFNKINLLIQNLNNDNTIKEKEKETILNVLSVIPNSLNYWGNNLTKWQSKIDAVNYYPAYKKNPTNIIPPVPNCPDGQCWGSGTWQQELHAITEVDFWGAAANIVYTWWATGTPVQAGAAIGGAATSSITYVIVWVLKGGTGCQPCGNL